MNDFKTMTNESIIKAAEFAAETNAFVYLYILNKPVRVGKFIKRKDSMELLDKGFLVFLPVKNLGEYEITRSEHLSTLVDLKFIAEVRICK